MPQAGKPPDCTLPGEALVAPAVPQADKEDRQATPHKVEAAAAYLFQPRVPSRCPQEQDLAQCYLPMDRVQPPMMDRAVTVERVLLSKVELPAR